MLSSLPGYDNLELIGEGGLGRVSRATRESTGGLVAIKELRDVASASPAWHRARRELDAMLRLKGHASVVSVEEIVVGPNGPCIVMEYVAGGSLLDRLASGPLPLPEVVLIGAEVSDALAAAHAAGVVHRDIKPHNILVTSFGHVKVCDFGIAALARDAGARTQTNALTLAYASPEELDGSEQVGPPADVYSLSATLQHLYTGHKPSFQERLAGERTLDQLAAGTGPVDQLVLRALSAAQSHDPRARPTTQQLAAVFDRAAIELGPVRLARLDAQPATDATIRRRFQPLTEQRALPPPTSVQPLPSTVSRPPPPSSPPPSMSPSPAPPSSRGRGPVVAITAAVAALLIGGFALLAFGRGGDDDSHESVPRTTDTRTTDAGADGSRSTSAPTTAAVLELATTSSGPAAEAGLFELPPGPTPCPAPDGSSPHVTEFAAPPPMCIDTTKTYAAVVTTNFGDLAIALDPAAAPQTVNNYVVLARYHFFDDTTCHRAITGFMVQCGDPGNSTGGLGTGGPGYEFADENPAANSDYVRGAVAMANAGPDTNGSQFFITTSDSSPSLETSYSLFGQVTDGLDTTLPALDALGSNPAANNGVPPSEQIVIQSVTITETAAVQALPTTAPPAPPEPATVPPATAAPGVAELTALVDADRAYVTANMLGAYVVQVNAKVVNQVDKLDGLFYDAQAIVDTYHEMGALRGPIVIIRQDEFNHSTAQPDLYQMLLRQTFASQADGKAWCDATGLVIDDCFARRDPLVQS